MVTNNSCGLRVDLGLLQCRPGNISETEALHFLDIRVKETFCFPRIIKSEIRRYIRVYSSGHNYR